MVIGKGIAKRDHPLMVHHMIAWRDQHQPIFGKRKGLQFFGGVYLVSNDADLGEVSGHRAHDFAAGMLLQIDVIGEYAHAAPEPVSILRQLPPIRSNC